MTVFELQVYQTVAGAQLFTTWLDSLADPQARARIRTRLDRLALGNFGDHHALDGGVFELRIDWGPGYRVYFARIGKTIVLLLCAGDKRTQTRDIKDAKRTYRTIGGARKKSVPAAVPYEPQLLERLRDPREAAAYLDAAIEDGDEGGLMLALRHVAQALGGVAALARKSKLTREATYRMLSASGNPELRSLTAILGAAGLRLSVEPIAKRAA